MDWQLDWQMDWQNQLSSNFSLEVPQTSGQLTAQPAAGDDVPMPAVHHQYRTSGDAYLTSNNPMSFMDECGFSPAPHSAHQLKMAGDLTAVGAHLDSQQVSDAGYDYPEMMSGIVEGTQDAPPSLTVNTAAAESPLNQRKPRAPPPSPQDWENHKGAIQSLYLKKNLSLAATIEKMKTDYMFFATEKMYKDKFKEWKWSKNLPRVITAVMYRKGIRRMPKDTIFHWNNQTWSSERVRKSYSRASGETGFSNLEDYPSPEDIICETPPLSDIADTESTPKSSSGIVDSFKAIAIRSIAVEELCTSIDKGPHRTCSLSEVPAVVQAALQASKEGKHEEAETRFGDALSCYYHLLSPFHKKTLETGYSLASFYVDQGRTSDAFCILDWMTKKHYGRSKSCNSKIVNNVLNVIAFLNRKRLTEEAEFLIYRLLQSRQDSGECHFLLQDSFESCIISNEMIEHVLTFIERDKLATMIYILENLAADRGNCRLLLMLLPQYIKTCKQQGIVKIVIQSTCIWAELLIKNVQFDEVKLLLGDNERLLEEQVDRRYPLQQSTLTLIQRVAFAYLEANDPDSCVRVLTWVMATFNVEHINESGSGYGNLVSQFFTSTASKLHRISSCERSHPWTEDFLSLSKSLFGQQHECTKFLGGMLQNCNN
ncbi:hypothetical protein V8C35DRAFT_305945 [Trichoderma chlorosporum]